MKTLLLLIAIAFSNNLISQKLLTSWSQQNIENYTKEMYDEARKLTSDQLLSKNINSKSWSEVFLTLNASVNNFSQDNNYHKKLAEQISNSTETKLIGTSRLIIWDRIITGDIIFEGKGLVIDNDLFKVSGRANQILQNLTKKNFGNVSVNSSSKDLEEIRKKWLNFLSGKQEDEVIPQEYTNSIIPEISSLAAVQALILSLQENPLKQQLTKNCLKNVYKLDEMPKEQGPSSYCNPDTYTYAYLGMIFGDEKADETKDANWWKAFWENNRNKLSWNSTKGIYELKQ